MWFDLSDHGLITFLNFSHLLQMNRGLLLFPFLQSLVNQIIFLSCEPGVTCSILRCVMYVECVIYTLICPALGRSNITHTYYTHMCVDAIIKISCVSFRTYSRIINYLLPRNAVDRVLPKSSDIPCTSMFSEVRNCKRKNMVNYDG